VLKFFLGLVAGTVLSILYVAFNVQLPEFMQIPGLVRGGIISSTTDEQLYDISGDAAARQRALVVYFDNRAGDAAAIDAAAGSPFLNALHTARAAREARLLAAQWDAYDKTLSQPALREALVRRHGTDNIESLKQAMLWEARGDFPFLSQWIAARYGAPTAATFHDTLVNARRDTASIAVTSP